MADLPPPEPTGDDHDAPGDEDGPRAPVVGGQGPTLLIGGALVAVLLLAIVAAMTLSDGDQQPPTVPAGADPENTPGFGLTDAVDELPDATLTGFAGGPDVRVADLLGQTPLVINFWATWCAPCVAEMPDLQTLHEAGGGAFHMVGINTQDAALNAEPFVEELGITYDQLVDLDASYFRATGGFGMPTTLFVHPDGGVAFRHTGPLALGQMQDLLAQHLDVSVAVDPQ